MWPDCPIADLTEVIQSPRQVGFLARAENKQAIAQKFQTQAIPPGTLTGLRGIAKRAGTAPSDLELPT